MSRRLFVAVAAACGLTLAPAVPALSSATIIEIGKIESNVKPGCPRKPCFAVSRTTGFQAKVGTRRGLMIAPRSGRIVAWTIALGKPNKKQTSFFNSKLGGQAAAQLTVLDPRKAPLYYRAIVSSPRIRLAPYFGKTVTFPLTRTLAVKKGQVIGLTVPTWAPSLATGLGDDTSWRASRAKGQCEDTQTQTAQTQPNQLAQYYCLYRTARLAYSATLIPYAKRAR